VTEAVTRVLVVEDDPAVAEIYRLALERAGYSVAIAKDGVECLERVQQEAPAFIFLDIRMPRLDGIQALRELNARRNQVPVVMLSNFDDPALIRESKSLGARDYIVKAGTNPTELAAIVARWLGEAAATD
jgi:CheY-like chemotaxis protein